MTIVKFAFIDIAGYCRNLCCYYHNGSTVFSLRPSSGACQSGDVLPQSDPINKEMRSIATAGGK